MRDHRNNRQYVRKLTLPSGRRIEVVYFEGQEVSEREHNTPDLHLCGSCGCELVYPIDWEPVGKTYWRVTLRCPNCEWTGTGVFSQDAVDEFDRELDKGMHKLQHTLTRVSRACMEAEIEVFARALATDLIVPFDF